jgi:hypothetical protein
MGFDQKEPSNIPISILNIFNKVLKKKYGFQNFFESINIENNGFKYFYPGLLYAKDEWIANIRINDNEFQLYISGP